MFPGERVIMRIIKFHYCRVAFDFHEPVRASSLTSMTLAYGKRMIFPKTDFKYYTDKDSTYIFTIF